MDLRAVCNRIDDLEQMVILQAREIDNLKKILGNTSHHSQSNNNISTQQRLLDYYSFTTNEHVTRKSYIPPSTNQSNMHPSNLPTAPTTNSPLFQHQMNSFVHPLSAIPPVAIRPNANVRSTASTITQSPQVASRESEKLVRNLNGLLSENRPPPPIGGRWSLMANATDNIQREPSHYVMQHPNGSPGVPNKDELDEVSKKHERQSFVECFEQWRAHVRDKSNRENKSPCDTKERENQRLELDKDAQQVQSSYKSASTTVPNSDKQSADSSTKTSTIVTCLRPKEIKTSPRDDLTEYIVGELELLPEGFNPTQVKEISAEQEEPAYFYITFNKPNDGGSQLWQKINHQTPRKRKHCSADTKSVSIGWTKHDIPKSGENILQWKLKRSNV